jgi:hypothetical protein
MCLQVHMYTNSLQDIEHCIQLSRLRAVERLGPTGCASRTACEVWRACHF